MVPLQVGQISVGWMDSLRNATCRRNRTGVRMMSIGLASTRSARSSCQRFIWCFAVHNVSVHAENHHPNEKAHLNIQSGMAPWLGRLPPSKHAKLLHTSCI